MNDVSVPSSSGIGLKRAADPPTSGASRRVSVPSSSGIGLKRRTFIGRAERLECVSVPSSSGIGLKQTVGVGQAQAIIGFSPLLIGDRFEALAEYLRVHPSTIYVSVPSSSGIGLKRGVSIAGSCCRIVSVPSSSGIGLKRHHRACRTRAANLRFSPLLIGDRFEASSDGKVEGGAVCSFQSPPHRGSV